MSDQAVAAEAIVPVKVPQPEDNAPPSLAQPASGPVAEMHGALPNHAQKLTEATTAETTTDSDAPAAQAIIEKSPEERPAAVDVEESAGKLTEETVGITDVDTEMKHPEPESQNETAQPADSSAPAASTNGTPMSKPKRKSSAGIPEHKTKTLKKKQSKAKITNLDAAPGDYYLARLKSYPPWPSIVCDEAMLPEILHKTRPVTARQADGTYKEPYRDDGKKVTERTYAVMFLHTNEFGWIPNTDLTPLSVDDAKNVSEKGKAKALIEAYKVAAEGKDLEHYKEMLIAHQTAMQEDEQLKAEKAAEKAAKAEKKKRKSEVKVDEDVEMEDVDAAKKPSKKRKKEAESDDEESDKPAKTPKTTKLKLTTGKTPQTDKKTEKKAPKPKSEKKKKAPESEEEAEPEKEQVPVDPVQERKDREKEILFLRHKLQKGFLARDQEPSVDEMPQMATYIKKLEAYDGRLEVGIIRATKINKVLKGIVKLNSIPKDEEFHFRERSVKLLSVWNQLLGAEAADGEKKEDKASPATNGVPTGLEEGATAEKSKAADESESKPTPEEVEVVDLSSTEVPAAGEDKENGPAPEDATSAPQEEPVAEEKPAIAVDDKAPESAVAAAEATEMIKATE